MNRTIIELGGKEYRVEFNWNTISSYLKATGKDEMDALVNWKLSPSEIAQFLEAALKEGARLDGVEFMMNSEELGALLSVAKVYEFLRIFNEHIGAGTTEKKENPSKKKGIFHR